MAERLEHAAIHHRTDLGTVAERALEGYLGGSHYRDQSSGSRGSGNPSGPEPAPAPPAPAPALHVPEPEPGEGDGSAVA